MYRVGVWALRACEFGEQIEWVKAEVRDAPGVGSFECIARLAAAERIHPMKVEHVQVDVHIYSRSEALKEGDRTAARTTGAGQSGFSDPVRDQGCADCVPSQIDDLDLEPCLGSPRVICKSGCRKPLSKGRLFSFSPPLSQSSLAHSYVSV